MKRTLLLSALIALTLCTALPGKAAESVLSSYSFDKKKASKDWSTRKTFIIGENRRLGLFNDRNKRFPSQTVLTLTEIPSGKELELMFDMIFVGSWDNEGKLADKFTLAVDDGPELLSMTTFPCILIDNDDSRPVGNDGWVQVGPKDRAYWIKPVTIKIPEVAIIDGSLKLKFKGFLTGRKTEFWALDNVRINVIK